MHNSNLWYWKQNGKVTGPFPAGQIHEYILLKRIHPNDLVSQDKETWCRVVSIPELLPDILKHKKDENFKDRLQAAKRWADDRNTDRLSVNKEGKEIHHTNTHVNIKTFGWGSAVILFVLIALIIAGSFYFMPQKSMMAFNCQHDTDGGLNYDNCKKNGEDFSAKNLQNASFNNAELSNTNFHASKLSHTLFKYAELIGADLSRAKLDHADLTGANLSGAKLDRTDFSFANLSYADLSKAKAKNIKLKQTQLSKTIWFNGQVCAQGSIGKCLVKGKK